MKKVLLVHNQYRQFGGEDSAVSGDEKMLLENYFVEKHIYDNKESIDFYDFINFIFLTNPKSNNSLNKKIKEFNPDIIYIHNLWFKGSLGIFRLIKKHKIPVVVKIHNFRYLCSSTFLSKRHNKGNKFCPACGLSKKFLFNKYFPESYIKSLFSIRFSKKFLKLLKKSNFNILLLTQHHKHILLNENIDNNRLFVMPNYIHSESTKIEEKENTFIYAGRVSKEKDVEEIIKSFLSINLPNYKLNILGTGPDLSRLKKKYEYDNIKFFGFLDNDEVLKFIKKSKVVISATKLYEGQPSLLCEASLNSVPIIFPDNGGIKEFLPKNYKFLYEQSNYNSLQEAMNNIVNEDIEKIGKENYDFISKLINKDKLLKVFSEAASE